ncbi:ABC transporter permease [Allosediminivita pacifica]|uniref:Peptide/nickel transport system permease protein n=1 Tax=Allosediminivita pacifica TaxID=1267769 RepID=A0A2T6ACL6_9RHOB|nr:ABC transporter permease [Allosediminivita pacifica]PTX41557.1 peptide/nickel transport system permease protein [Allosediminivita pacifica]GGB23015.1 peptide ABC transporter permease [Allosediminivita pacifica]
MNPVLRLLLQRLAISLLVLVGVSILIFFVARVVPGDPARIALGPNASQAAVDAMREARHLNDPLIIQYGWFVRDLAQGDLGTSLYTRRPVTTDIAAYLPATLELVFVAGAMMILLGLPLGRLAARYAKRGPDHAARFAAVVAVCTPAFVWGVILQLLLAYIWPIFPLEGRLSNGVDAPPGITGFYTLDSLMAGQFATFFDALYHLILPATALALSGIGQSARLTRSSMIETYRKPFIEMSRAYGFREDRISRRYAFRPALIPTLTILGLDFAAMLANAFLVERVFVWPGLSRYGVEVILRKDLDAIVGVVLVIAAMFLVTNLIVDLIVSIINPRIRLAERRAKS